MSSDDPNWPRASAWLRGEFARKAVPSLAVIGVPMNRSLTPGRCDLAPDAIRKALERFSTYDVELGMDLCALSVVDRGDIGELTSGSLAASPPVILLGGDNSVTLFGMRAMDVPLARCGLLTFDAHHDLRDLDRGLTNGNPIRALLAEGLRGENIVQIGIQPFTNSAAYAAVAREQKITVIITDEVYATGIDAAVVGALETLSRKTGAIYVDLDVDVLDRAFAPACPGSRPGGLQPWMLRRAARICGAHSSVRMMDIVEVDPSQDIADITCLAAGSFLLAFASGVASRNPK